MRPTVMSLKHHHDIDRLSMTWSRRDAEMPKNTWATAGQSEATQACKFIRLRLQAVITAQLDLSHKCESKTPTAKDIPFRSACILPPPEHAARVSSKGMPPARAFKGSDSFHSIPKRPSASALPALQLPWAARTCSGTQCPHRQLEARVLRSQARQYSLATWLVAAESLRLRLRNCSSCSTEADA